MFGNQLEYPSLPKKALLVTSPTEKGDSMGALEFWLQIVRDKEAEKNAEWKNPRVASLPSELLQVYVFDLTDAAEQALIQPRDDIQEQHLGPNDGGASAQLIRPATLERHSFLMLKSLPACNKRRLAVLLDAANCTLHAGSHFMIVCYN